MPHRRYRPQPRPSNSTNLVLLGAGLVIVALIGVFLFGGGKREEPRKAEPVAEQPVVPRKDPRKDPKNQARFWFERNFTDDAGRFRKLSGAQIHKLFEEAKKRGYPALLGAEWKDKQQRVYALLLKREPNDPDANRFMGRIPLSDYPHFFKVFRSMSDEVALPKDMAALRNRYEGSVKYGPTWRAPAVDRAEFTRVSGLLKKYELLKARLDKDPTERAIHEAVARVKTDPILGLYETVHIRRPPWVLFYAHKDLTPKDDSEREQRRIAAKREELKKRLDSYTTLFNDYLAYFRANWMKPLGLPEFEPAQLLYVWMFDDRRRFDQYGARIGQFNPPGLLGYFDFKDNWVYVYEPAKSRYTVESSLAHELTHQLHWHFSKDSGQFQNHFHRIQATWFKEGWAEYVGWCKRGKDGHFVFGQDAPPRMADFHDCRKENLPVYPLREFVKAQNYAHYRLSVLKWLARELAQRRRTPKNAEFAYLERLYFSLLYSQGWLLMKFCYEHENGKYKPAILEFTKASLKGYLGYTGARGYPRAHEVFAQCFKLKTTTDWARFQREFDGFIEKKLYEIPKK